MVEQRTTEAISPTTDVRHSVDYHHSAEEYVYVSLRITGGLKQKAGTTLAFNAFLFMNVVAFPAFLLFSGYVIVAGVIFAVNVTAQLILLPRANSDHFRVVYEQLFGDRDKFPVRVELTGDGVNYFYDGGTTFWPWRRIRAIEETDDAIYFFVDVSGFGVQKSGFAYRDDERAFFEFAQEQVRHHHQQRSLPE